MYHFIDRPLFVELMFKFLVNTAFGEPSVSMCDYAVIHSEHELSPIMPVSYMTAILVH